jgi:hypothetical protein
VDIFEPEFLPISSTGHLTIVKTMRLALYDGQLPRSRHHPDRSDPRLVPPSTCLGRL